MFTLIKNAKFKESFLTELISLTYVKGYQTQDEDDELRKIAGFVGIQEKKADAMLEDMYFAAQGISRKTGLSSTAAKVGITVGAVAVEAALVAVTAGAAAIVTAGGIIGAGTGALSASVAGNISNAHDKKQLKAFVIKEMKEKKLSRRSQRT